MNSSSQIATNNVEAHNAYLQGHFHFQRRNRRGLSQGDQLLRSRQSELDPELCFGLRGAVRSVDAHWRPDRAATRPRGPKARSDAEKGRRDRA